MTDRKIRFLSRVFACRFRFAETARYFQSAPDASEPASSELISLAPEDWKELAREGIEASAYIEYTVLTPYVSDALLPFDCVVLHAVALRWRGRAYLICAKSGVGKSTQARWLRELRPGEFDVICGDRPILEFCQPDPVAAHSVRHLPAPAGVDAHVGPSASPVQSLPLEGKVSPKATDEVVPRRASNVTAPVGRPDPRPPSPVGADAHIGPPPILVHPSPWNGKENWHGAPAAPLAGLILLERGERNRLVSLRPREAALETYPHFLQSGRDEKNLCRVAELETRLLSAVPIWRLTTREVPASTELLLEAVFS